MEELIKEIKIWDKWSFDEEKQCIICFTVHDQWEEKSFFGKTKIISRYKAKAWLDIEKFGLTEEKLKALYFDTELLYSYTNHTTTFTVKEEE